jgi:hypothetical protein
MEIQRTRPERNATVPEDRRIEYRMGINVGDIIIDEGSVRRSGDRLRVTAELIEAVTGNHLWVERYDRPRDAKTISLVISSWTANTVIEPRMAASQASRLRVERPTRAFAVIQFNTQRSPKGIREARAYFERAASIYRNIRLPGRSLGGLTTMKLEPLIDVRTPLPAASCRSDKAKREEKQLHYSLLGIRGTDRDQHYRRHIVFR